MANAAANEPVGMGKADLKRMLRLARKQPIHAAFALGGDGKAIVVLDKRKQPRALERGIKEEAPDAKNHRWGSVSIDPDEPKIARFMVNKASSGMARKLVIALKGTGFPKVHIVLEDGTPIDMAEGEPEEDQDDGQEAADGDEPEDMADDADHPEAPQDASPDAAPQPAASSDPSPGAAPQPAADQPDAATLTQTLTGLVKQMMAVVAQDPSQKAGLAELATAAQASLKRGDLAQAAAGIEILRQAIAAAGPGSAPAAPASADQSAPNGQDPADIPITATQADGAANGADPQPEAGPSFNPADDTSGSDAPASGPDPAALTATLTALVKQLMPMVAADPSQRDALKGIVSQAQACLQIGDLQTASTHVDSLRAMLDGGGAQGGAVPASDPQSDTGGAPRNGAAATFVKSRMVWLAARKKVDGDINKLHGEFMAAFKDHAKADDIGAAFQKRVGGVMDKLDERLAHKLDEMAKNTDAAQHAKLVQEAKQLVDNYQSYLASEPLIATLDNNPFTPLAIQKTMTATLAALGNALH